LHRLLLNQHGHNHDGTTTEQTRSDKRAEAQKKNKQASSDDTWHTQGEDYPPESHKFGTSQVPCSILQVKVEVFQNTFDGENHVGDEYLGQPQDNPQLSWNKLESINSKKTKQLIYRTMGRKYNHETQGSGDYIG